MQIWKQWEATRQLLSPHVRQLWPFSLEKTSKVLDILQLQQWRRVGANSEMHLTVLSRVEDESRFPSRVQSNWTQCDGRDWICEARNQEAAALVDLKQLTSEF